MNRPERLTYFLILVVQRMGSTSPDATTLLKFRHRLATAGLTKTIFDTINALLRERGLLMNKATVSALSAQGIIEITASALWSA